MLSVYTEVRAHFKFRNVYDVRRLFVLQHQRTRSIVAKLNNCDIYFFLVKWTLGTCIIFLVYI